MADLTPAAYQAKWTQRFRDNDQFEIDEADFRENIADQLRTFAPLAAASGKTLGELILPQQVTNGQWYAWPTGIFEARSTFQASAAPVAGPNWRLVVAFSSFTPQDAVAAIKADPVFANVTDPFTLSIPGQPNASFATEALAVAALSNAPSGATMTARRDILRAVVIPAGVTLFAAGVAISCIESAEKNTVTIQSGGALLGFPKVRRAVSGVGTAVLSINSGLGVNLIQADIYSERGSGIVAVNGRTELTGNILVTTQQAVGAAEFFGALAYDSGKLIVNGNVTVDSNQLNAEAVTAATDAQTEISINGEIKILNRGRLGRLQGGKMIVTRACYSKDRGFRIGSAVGNMDISTVVDIRDGLGEAVEVSQAFAQGQLRLLPGHALLVGPGRKAILNNNVAVPQRIQVAGSLNKNGVIDAGISVEYLTDSGAAGGQWPGFTNAVVDDVAKTFKATAPPNFRTAELEYRRNSSAAWAVVTDNMRAGDSITLIAPGAVPVGEYQFRVRAGSGRMASEIVSNQTAITAPSNAIPAGVLDNAGFAVDENGAITRWNNRGGWAVVDGVLQGSNTDYILQYTQNVPYLSSGNYGAYQVVVNAEIEGGAILTLYVENCSFTDGGGNVRQVSAGGTVTYDITLNNQIPGLFLRAENGGLIKVKYAQLVKV